jgi:hypothetical protein
VNFDEEDTTREPGTPIDTDESNVEGIETAREPPLIRLIPLSTSAGDDPLTISSPLRRVTPVAFSSHVKFVEEDATREPERRR